MACDGPQGGHWRGSRDLDNRSREGWLCAVALVCITDEPLLINVHVGAWPGVRRAGLPRQSPALTPGQRRRRRRA
jgi:hypothetical protein